MNPIDSLSHRLTRQPTTSPFSVLRSRLRDDQNCTRSCPYCPRYHIPSSSLNLTHRTRAPLVSVCIHSTIRVTPFHDDTRSSLPCSVLLRILFLCLSVSLSLLNHPYPNVSPTSTEVQYSKYIPMSMRNTYILVFLFRNRPFRFSCILYYICVYSLAFFGVL
jgi:hypothetical protein